MVLALNPSIIINLKGKKPIGTNCGSIHRQENSLRQLENRTGGSYAILQLSGICDVLWDVVLLLQLMVALFLITACLMSMSLKKWPK